MMRRHAIYFTEDDHVTGLSVYASPDVVEQLRACLGKVSAEPNGFVNLPVTAAAKAGKWAGGFSPVTSPDYGATSAIYECLIYGVFNVFWENGVDSALAGVPSW